MVVAILWYDVLLIENIPEVCTVMYYYYNIYSVSMHERKVNMIKDKVIRPNTW